MESTERSWTQSLRWLVSIGAKFFRVVPLHTSCVVGASLVSLVSMILAFLLPLKVIILVGSERIPSYFPQFLAEVPRDTLIPLLAGAAVGLYILHLAADRLCERVVDRGTSILMGRSRKIALFEDQEQVARQAYRRYVEVLASVVFVSIGLGFLVLVYPALALALPLYGVLAGVLLQLLSSAREGARNPAGPNQGVKFASDLGFLFAFTLMIVDYVLGTSPSVLISILSLLIVRQLIQRTAAAFLSGWSLVQQRVKISALFFYGHSLAQTHPSAQSGYWPLLFEPFCSDWIATLLAKAAPNETFLRCEWRQTGTAGVAAFLAHTSTQRTGAEKSYLIRIFNTQMSVFAQHEATIITDWSASKLPAPGLLAVDEIEGFHCHLFEWNDFRAIPPASIGLNARKLSAGLIAIDPPIRLSDQYSRSKPLLWQRFDDEVVERLGIAASTESTRSALSELSASLAGIKDRLRQVPLQLRNPGQTVDSLVLDSDDQVVALSWGRWNLDPVGAGWPISDQTLEELGVALQSASKRRAALRDVSMEHVLLVALVSELERLYLAQLYANALDVIPRILESYRKLTPTVQADLARNG